ncbi:hypothetical protein CC86DRAFT_375760, partial [Ophiobolus disseminans]
MLNLPNIEHTNKPYPSACNGVCISANDARLCKGVMQQFATQVVRFMVNRGSSLKLFYTDPSISIDSTADFSADENGNQWPIYAYTSGRIVGLDGRASAVAIPVVACTRDMPECLALYHTA